MKIFALGLAACVLFGLSNEAVSETVAMSGVIKFQGEIVEAGCEHGRSGAVDYGDKTQLIDVAPNVVLAVNMASNACRTGQLPFVASYQKLNTPAYRKEQGVHNGVVTISYL